MPIPESQLETWAKQGPIDSSSKSYQSIKNALSYIESPIAPHITSGKVKVYLQGSYANDTNIRGDSDVDVVVELTETFHSNKTTLTVEERQAHDRHYDSATYSWEKFREDVITALQKYYGTGLVDLSGNKSLKVLPKNGRLRIDVVPVLTHREYVYFNSPSDHFKDTGVCLYHRITKKVIINYPEIHYNKGVDKHNLSSKWFKPAVRIFKNAVSHLIDNNKLTKNQAPSYFLQCLIYNVPSDKFGGSYQDTVVNVLKYLNSTDLSAFMCQHEMHNLFGSEDTYWNIKDAKLTIAELTNLWNDWYA